MKKIALLLMTIMALTTLAACGGADDNANNGNNENNANGGAVQDTSLQYILDKGEFVLGLDDAFPPMGFRDEEDKIVGFDIDLAAAVCDILGVKLVTQPVDWDSKEMELNTKSIDCIWNGMSITPAREAAMNMSAPYLANEMVFVVRADSGISTTADLAGKNLAVQAGSSAQDALNAATDVKESLGAIYEYESNLTALLDLETKGVDIVLMDSVVARYQIAVSGQNFVLLEDVLAPEYYAIGFRKDDIALGDAVEDALMQLKTNGTLAEISNKWFGDDVTLIGE